MPLTGLAEGYLQSLGYETTLRGTDLMIGNRLSIAGERDTILVWVPAFKSGQPFSSQEAPYLSRFEKAVKDYPRAQRFMLVPTLEGLTWEFRSRAKREYDVNIRVPIQFFDNLFKWEESEGMQASFTAGKLQRRGEQRTWARVPQPYVVTDGSGAQRGKDILDMLVSKISAQSATGLNLVVGPAGIGKTVFFEVLFANLYATFKEHKRQLRVSPRPLPLVPEYFRVAVGRTLVNLVEGFLRTEFVAPIGRDTLQWMLTNGFAIWLLDGLDELIDRDPSFFMQLLEILTQPGEREPTIVLCLRDSLLATNEGLIEFCEEYRGTVTVYELSRWETPSKRAFAKMELGEQEAEGFIAMLQTHREIDSLSSIPYYCKLILDEYGAGRLQESYSELGLLRSALMGIIEREYDKDLLDAALIPASSLIELLQDLASVDMTTDFQGLSRDTIAEYTAILLPEEIDRVTLDRLTTNMVQLAVFGQAPVAGNVQFAQEILEQYLLGERFYRNLVNNESLFLRELSVRPIPSEWVTLRTVAEKAREERNIQKLLKCLERPELSQVTFRNVLQICAYSVTEPTALRGIRFETRDLYGVRLSGLDFRGVSFRNCDLTHVEFDNCLLHDAKFEGAILRNTAFLLKNKEDMRGARFGNLQRFHSLRISPTKLEIDCHIVQQWLRGRTGVIEAIVEPCAASRQLRYLFGKYLHPNGLAKRAILDRHGVLSGKRFHDAERTLEAAIRHGYLVAEERYRDRVKRCDGDLYTEIINYVMDLTLSPGLRRLLDEVCPVENCTHIPELGATDGKTNQP